MKPETPPPAALECARRRSGSDQKEWQRQYYESEQAKPTDTNGKARRSPDNAGAKSHRQFAKEPLNQVEPTVWFVDV